MTNRKFFEKVAAGEMNDEMKEFATVKLAKMAEDAEKRKGHKSKKDQEKAAANENLARHIADNVLTAEAKTATDVAEVLNADRAEDDRFTVQKVSCLCRMAVDMGLAVQTEVKIPKKGAQKAYQLVESLASVED